MHEGLRFTGLIGLVAASALVAACGNEDGRPMDATTFDTGIASLSIGTGDSESGSAENGDGDPTGDGEPGDGDPGDPCAGVGDVEGFIWIANSAEGTVSKIDTSSGTELGRYIVRADSAGSPSRTSVNNRGDVAVANRLGGVTMIYANQEDCNDTNGTPGIQTSTGAGDVLPWGQDECVGWHTPIPHSDNRPIAWTVGYPNPDDSCNTLDRDVWTAWSDVALGTATAALLDGNTGAIIQQIPMPEVPEAWPGWFGFYGGAVDKDDNFWISQLQGGLLVRVNRDDFSYDTFPVPGEGGYGMTVTPDGYIWLCGRSTHRFEPTTETWTSIAHFADPDSIHTGGCMGDGENLLWRGSYSQLYAVNAQTLAVTKQIPVTQGGDDFIWGVAVDFDGYIWAIPRNGSRAYKVDPTTDSVVLTVEGLVGAYTYSDMTGFALSGVGAIP